MKKETNKILKDIRLLLKFLIVLIAINTFLSSVSSCELYRGTVDSNIKITVYSDDYRDSIVKSYANFVYTRLRYYYPYNQMGISVYLGRCDNMSYKDVEIELLDDLPKYVHGRAYQGLKGRYPAKIWTSKKKDYRVLLHELGHAYSLKHTNIRGTCMYTYRATCRRPNPYSYQESQEILRFIGL